MRMSMMSPIPFWPSLEPWAKLTPVQVRTSRPRIQKGGGASPLGASKSGGSLMTTLNSSSNNAAKTKPTIGDVSSERNTLPTCAQSTPLVPVEPDISWLATPTPIIEPIRVCELEAGNPYHQVLRFQRMAETSSAKTIAKPAPDPTLRINSTGNRETTANATAPEESNTPIRFHMPDHITATWGSSEWV